MSETNGHTCVGHKLGRNYFITKQSILSSELQFVNTVFFFLNKRH